MVDVSVAGGIVTFRVRGLHKLWALRSKIRVPARDIVKVERGETMTREWAGWRLPGTWFPGVITAGSYLKKGQWSFWDVVSPERTIVVTTKGHRFSRLIVEVADPVAEMSRLETAMSRDHRSAVER